MKELQIGEKGEKCIVTDRPSLSTAEQWFAPLNGLPAIKYVNAYDAAHHIIAKIHTFADVEQLEG